MFKRIPVLDAFEEDVPGVRGVFFHPLLEAVHPKGKFNLQFIRRGMAELNEEARGLLFTPGLSLIARSPEEQYFRQLLSLKSVDGIGGAALVWRLAVLQNPWSSCAMNWQRDVLQAMKAGTVELRQLFGVSGSWLIVDCFLRSTQEFFAHRSLQSRGLTPGLSQLMADTAIATGKLIGADLRVRGPSEYE